MHLYPFHRSKHHNELYHTESHATDDGRISISFPSHLFHGREHRSSTDLDEQENPKSCKQRRLPLHQRKDDFRPLVVDFKTVPRMNVAILITGSRGDVQPFIALGQTLQKAPYCHRVRICTHPVFKDFVLENGLEFYSIGGDPSKLLLYMTKNPGVIPSFESIRAGDVGARKADIHEMMEGAWKACTSPGDGMTTIDPDAPALDKDVLISYPAPFVADAIIANPPTYAHIHIAEKLAIPCHLMFTMPWSPTRAFPHPLTNFDASKVENAAFANFLSYKKMELLTWEGLSDVINHFREKTLGLDAISPLWGHRLITQLRVPFTYCWSEALIPKPADWGSHITIAGFFFLPLASSFKPDEDLQAFLDAGPPPVYIGFGSIVVDHPQALTKMVLEAVEKAGVRALVSKGWGGIGGTTPPKNVYLLGNVPHDWLFPRVSAVVHHGGAGTTAIGIALGKPTVIVPFFGDQPFWANMVYRAGAGPEPVPFKKLTSDRLAESIKAALSPEVQGKAHELSEKIKGEEGPKNAAEAFQNTQQMKNVGCFILPDRVAVWRLRRTNIQISSLAAAVLVTRGMIKPQQLKLVSHKRWYVEEGSQDPLVGFIGAFTSTVIGLVTDLGDLSKGMRGSMDSAGAITAAKDQQIQPSTDMQETTNGPSSSTSTPSMSALDVVNFKPPGRTDTFAPSHIKNRNKGMMPALGSFVQSSASHVAKLPVALLYNLANGFHNAPAQFGDTTVRVRDPITGLFSGLKVGGKELAFGLYDAFSGLVTQPVLGFQEGKNHHGGSAAGLAKGVGLGLLGLASKMPAALIGPLGYGGKGLERELQRWHRGTDTMTGAEIKVIIKAKEGVRGAGLGLGDDEGHAAGWMWNEAKGRGVGKRIMERRVWQGYREVRELQDQGDEGKKVEDLVLQRWEQLKVDESFLASLLS